MTKKKVTNWPAHGNMLPKLPTCNVTKWPVPSWQSTTLFKKKKKAYLQKQGDLASIRDHPIKLVLDLLRDRNQVLWKWWDQYRTTPEKNHQTVKKRRNRWLTQIFQQDWNFSSIIILILRWDNLYKLISFMK